MPAVSASRSTRSVSGLTMPFASAKRIGIVAAVALGVGTLLPWFVSTDPDFGTLTRSGIDGGSEGLTVLVMAFVGLIGLVIETRTGAIAAAVAAFVGLLLGIHDLFPSPDLIGYMGLPGDVSTGFGLYLSLAGGLVLLAAAAYRSWKMESA
jgi:hypothetical protein